MQVNELQISLLIIGAVAVAGVIAYNKWQERKARRSAEQAFRSEHADVLLEPQHAASEPAQRLEPVLDLPDEDVREEQTAALDEDQHGVEAPDAEPSLPEPPAPVDEGMIDCVAKLEADEMIAAHVLWQAQLQIWRQLSKPVLWFGLSEQKGKWELLNQHSAGTYRILYVALQLADRHGALSERDLSVFVAGLRQFEDRFQAVVDVPERAAALARAVELDAFCAEVDVQIGLNIVSVDGNAFPGTKLRGIAEAAGFSLQEDGAFHAQDDEGHTLFTLSNLEPALFCAEEMKSLATRAITLSLDVPRVANGSAAFNRMTLVAGQLASSLHGAVVDDNRVPLSESALQMIRGKIAELQRTMEQRGIPAGSTLAMRLFQ